MEVKQDELFLCTVKRIDGTTVFVELEGNGEATLMLSEVAAGRIRNLREYVTPGKKIVCKVLKVSGGHIEMSLRRVTGKERDTVLEKNKREKILMNILKTQAGNAAAGVLEKIKLKYDLIEFFEKARENPKIFEEFLDKSQAAKIAEIFAEKGEKEKVVKKTFVLKSFSEQGVKDIQEVLEVEGAQAHYLGSSMFSVETQGKDFKEANGKLAVLMESIEKRAKEKKVIFEVKEK